MGVMSGRRHQGCECRERSGQKTALAGVAQWAGASAHKQKGRRFDSWTGHMPRLQVWFPVGVHTRGNRLLFLSFSPPHSLPLSLKIS